MQFGNNDSGSGLMDGSRLSGWITECYATIIPHVQNRTGESIHNRKLDGRHMIRDSQLLHEPIHKMMES